MDLEKPIGIQYVLAYATTEQYGVYFTPIPETIHMSIEEDISPMSFQLVASLMNSPQQVITDVFQYLRTNHSDEMSPHHYYIVEFKSDNSTGSFNVDITDIDRITYINAITNRRRLEVKNAIRNLSQDTYDKILEGHYNNTDEIFADFPNDDLTIKSILRLTHPDDYLYSKR